MRGTGTACAQGLPARTVLEPLALARSLSGFRPWGVTPGSADAPIGLATMSVPVGRSARVASRNGYPAVSSP